MLSLTTKSTRALQVFQVLRFIAMLTIGIAMARLGYGKTAIGNYEAVLFLSGLLTTFWITGLIQALLPLYNGSQDISNDNRLFNAFLVIVGLTILACIVALAFSDALKGIATFENRHLFYLMLLYLLLSTPSTMVEYIYLLRAKYKAMLCYGLITYGIQIILVLLPVLMGLDVAYAVLGLIGVSAIRFIWLVILIGSNSKFSINVDFLKEYLGDGIPLSLKFLVSSSGLYIDQLIIGYYYDPSIFAVYRFGAREIPVITILAVSLSNSMLADFADRQKLNLNLDNLRHESLRLMHIIFPISIAAILLARWLFPLVFGSEFHDSANVFMIYCLLVISRVLFPQTVAQGFRKNMAILFISIMEMTLNIILSLLLVKHFGINGVASATVIVYILEKFMLLAYNSYCLKISAVKYVPVKAFLVYSLISLLAFAFAWLAL
ncbi:MAG: oligosaccharide flippase family protein [Bacteroidota bacterium]